MLKEKDLLEDNRKLVEEFGAERIQDIDVELIPDFYTFKKDLIYSHRDFDRFMEAVNDPEKDCAIVSGLNPSGTMHLGHRAVFDTNLFFQKKYDIPVFVPLSDDESYVSDKVETQDEAFRNALELSKELIAYGYDPEKTHIIIDRKYTSIYNLAIKYSKKLTNSQIKGAYGYEDSENPGMFFYPAIQSAHILLPMERFDKDEVLVPIGPDEDNHFRISRDIASRAGLNKPATIHISFVPGLDGKKMSTSKENYIGLNEDVDQIEQKIKGAYTGGHDTKEKHRKHGGNPEEDVPLFYLEKYFLSENEAEERIQDYKDGKILSGEIKEELIEEVRKFVKEFQDNKDEIGDRDVREVLMDNPDELNPIDKLKDN